MDNKKPVAIGFKLPAGTVKILDMISEELSVPRATLCKSIIISWLADGVSLEDSPCLNKSVLADLLRSGEFVFSELSAGSSALNARNNNLN